MVWARTAATTNFRKLWGKIEKDIPKGESLAVRIQNSLLKLFLFKNLELDYDESLFEGKKFIVITTNSYLGGRNKYLEWAFLFATILAFCI